MGENKTSIGIPKKIFYNDSVTYPVYVKGSLSYIIAMQKKKLGVWHQKINTILRGRFLLKFGLYPSTLLLAYGRMIRFIEYNKTNQSSLKMPGVQKDCWIEKKILNFDSLDIILSIKLLKNSNLPYHVRQQVRGINHLILIFTMNYLILIDMTKPYKPLLTWSHSLMNLNQNKQPIYKNKIKFQYMSLDKIFLQAELHSDCLNNYSPQTHKSLCLYLNLEAIIFESNFGKIYSFPFRLTYEKTVLNASNKPGILCGP